MPGILRREGGAGTAKVAAAEDLRLSFRRNRSTRRTHVMAKEIPHRLFVSLAHSGVALNMSCAWSLNKLLGAGNFFKQLAALCDWNKSILIAMEDQHWAHTQVGGVVLRSNFGCTNASEKPSVKLRQRC